MKPELVFRKPLFYGVAACVAVGCLAVFIVAAISRPNGSLFFGAVIISAFIYFFWLLGWQSSVRVVRTGVIVDNLSSRKFVPWRDLSEVQGGNGLLIVTRGGERIGSLMYGGSIIGAFTGSKQSRAVATQIKNAEKEVAAGGRLHDDSGNQEYRSGINLQVWPFLMVLALTELIAGLSYALR